MEHAVPGDIVGHLRYPGFGTERYWMYAAATEIERLRTVLKPFAECIDEHTVFCGNPDAAEVEIGNWANLRFSDFVKAREALAHEQAAGEKP